MIDDPYHGERKYPTQKLLEIKAKHESAVAEAMEEAMATVTFRELEEATRWVNTIPPELPARDFSRVPMEDKIKKHGLSLSSRNLIVCSLTATPSVRSFIQSLSQDDSGFAERLKSGFLEQYYKFRKEGITAGEDMFNRMCVFACRGFTDLKTQYAAQAVLIYLFETCEVFEQ